MHGAVLYGNSRLYSQSMLPKLWSQYLTAQKFVRLATSVHSIALQVQLLIWYRKRKRHYSHTNKFFFIVFIFCGLFLYFTASAASDTPSVFEYEYRIYVRTIQYTLCSIQYIWVSPNTPTIRRKGWREATLTPPWGPPMKSLKIKQFGTVGILKLCDSMHVEPNQRHGEKLMMHWVKVKTWNANDA